MGEIFLPARLHAKFPPRFSPQWFSVACAPNKSSLAIVFERWWLLVIAIYRNRGGENISPREIDKVLMEHATNDPNGSRQIGYEQTAAVTDMLWSRFEQVANMHADRPAVMMGDESLSYAELLERAEALACRIGEPKSGDNQVVAVLTQRGVPSIVGFLAVLRAGGSFVYLDPAHPQARIDAILRECGAECVVTDRTKPNLSSAFRGRVLICEDSDAVGTNRIRLPRDSPDEAACIIYTSGSTGEPKGVVHTHRTLGSEVSRFIHRHSLNTADRISQVLSPGVLGGLREILSALLSGATLYPFDLRTDGIGRFGSWLRNERITVFRLVSSFFRELMSVLPDTNNFPHARVLLLGGEAVSQSEVSQFRQQFPASCKLEIAYGLSETGICCCWFANVDFDRVLETVPVGFPTDDYKLRIVNESGEEVPQFQIGQIVVSSRYLSPGYWRQPQLTAQVYRGIATDPHGRWLWTGDLGRQHPDGLIEHLGRCDSQVQVRGNRVEIAEVEKVILNAPIVINAAVVPVKNKDQIKLVAFIHAESERWPIAQLRQWCASHLPECAIPNVFRYVECLPHTIQGKIDRQALVAWCMDDGFWNDAHSSLSAAYRSPQTTVENQLADIWKNRLGLSHIGVEDDFFELGGDSLVAMGIAVRASKAFGVEIQVGAMFTHRTVKSLAMHIASIRADLSSTEVFGRVSPARKQQLLRSSSKAENTTSLPLLSFAQQRLWFLEQMEGELTAYNMPYAWRLNGSLNIEALRRALEEIVRRHEPLRTTFAIVCEEPVQIIRPSERFDLPVEDLSGLESQQQNDQVVRRCGEETSRPFDLTVDRMLRASLLQLSDDEHLLLVTLHHIASDGWSQRVLWRELAGLYDAYSRGAESNLRELPVQYADYAIWQRSELEGQRLEQLLQYWRGQLAGVSTLELPTDRPRPLVPTRRGAQHNFEMPEALVSQLKGLSQAAGVTLHMTVLAAFQTLLSRYSGQDDIAVGVPIAGRSHAELEDLIGFFVNTLVLRTNLSDDPTFRELLGRVREVSLAAYDHQDLPFEKLVEELRPERQLNRSPLFQVLFQLLSFADEELALQNLDVSRLPTSSQRARFDLQMHVWQQDKTLRGRVVYSTDLFDHSTIERMVGHFITLLQGIAADADRPICALPLLTEPERHQLLVEWNDAAVDHPRDKCVHELFEEQVERTPEAIATIFEEQELTYREVNTRANCLAQILIGLGTGPGILVGLCVERSIEMVVGVLGILKAGGAYVPLDPELPSSRLRFIVQDADLRSVVTTSQHTPLFKAESCDLILVNELSNSRASETANPVSRASLSDPNYLLYTSGSTGHPKGVLVEHGQLLNYVQAVVAKFGMSGGGAYAMVQPLTVDSSQTMIFPALGWGGVLHLISRESALDASALANYFDRHSIDYLKIAPSHLSALLTVGQPRRLLPTRALIVGGEAMHWTLVSRLADLQPSCRVWNHYGPTETTVGVFTYPINLVDDKHRGSSATVPIGRPLANVTCYVLDNHGSAVPIGVAGELYIGGEGVTRGYLKRPELTAQQFIPDRFANSDQARLYRSGDFVRWLPGGEIEFLGRQDGQVKIRGIRIETGEIEAALHEHAEVRESVVILRTGTTGNPFLAAYVVPRTGCLPSIQSLRELLSRRLPEVMQPTAYLFLESLPRTPHGKVNRQALPAPDESRPDLETDYVAPRNPIEEQLNAIWCDVLGLAQIGIHDNFFALGGHSLLATRVIARISSALRVDLPMRKLFESPTITEFASEIETLRSGGLIANSTALMRVDRDQIDRLPLSFGQQRLWFLEQMEGELTAYNMPYGWKLRGSLDVEALRRALEEIVQRHEPLRTTFAILDDAPVQLIQPSGRFELLVEDLSSFASEVQAAEIQRCCGLEAEKPFNLSTDLMLRASLLHLANDEHLLLLTMHHIASDGWSLSILWRELAGLYDAYSRGAESNLRELPVQYADYAIWQRSELESQRLEQLLQYWREHLSGVNVLQLPTDRPRPPLPSYRGAKHSFELPEALVSQLKRLSQTAGVTLHMTLLAAFQTLLSRYSGQHDIAVGVPVAGRNQTELEDLIGFFVNTLVLRTDLSDDPTFRELLGRVREVSLAA
ncbi:MAG: amino acid adenylation domain-containing protein, partial [Planctomycetota bacterium]|nr:amino acid adenylation domain-containing protein [Planctomycetota bacterium]